MIRNFKNNQKILRAYIRKLVVAKNVNIINVNLTDLDNAIKFFIILHNYLWIEDLFYDQVRMAEKSINKYLSLYESIYKPVDIMNLYYSLYDRKNVVRKNIDTLMTIEEVRLLINSHNTLENNIFKKLKLNSYNKQLNQIKNK